MSIRHATKGLAASAVAAVALWAATLTAQQPPAPANDAEVLTRGPIHEAYAEPISGQPQPTPIIPKKPPDPIEEVPAEQKPAGDNVQWLPGYWAWDDDRGDFLWVSGFWRVPPPDRQWVPGYWTQAQDGWQWTPGFWADATQTQAAGEAQVTYLPPPPPPIDNGPSVPAPQADSIYVPGNWLYAQSRYVWRPGFWCAPRVGWMWIPAHYVWTPSGYVFVDGYWDYVLEDRGLPFAPVYFTGNPWARPGWFYRPRYLVYPDFLMSALFVRPGAYSYYFGDYFDPRYGRLGYRSWLDYRLSGSSPDPLFSYYRWHNRGNANWAPEMRQLYTGRFNGTVPRPPRTLVEQNTLVQNITNNTTTVTNINHVLGVAPVSNVDRRRTALKLEPVTAAQQQQVIQSARQIHATRQQRAQVETQLHRQGAAPLKVNDPPRTGKLSLPAGPVRVQALQTKAPPPRPAHPMNESRPIPKYVPPRPEIRTAPKTPNVRPTPKAEIKGPAQAPPAVKPAPQPSPAPKKPNAPAPEKKVEKKKQAFTAPVRAAPRPVAVAPVPAPAAHVKPAPAPRQVQLPARGPATPAHTQPAPAQARAPVAPAPTRNTGAPPTRQATPPAQGRAGGRHT
jgi:hypothetical protein